MHQHILNIKGIVTMLAIFMASSANSQSEYPANRAREIAMGRNPAYSSHAQKPEPYVNLNIQEIGITGYVKRVLPFGCVFAVPILLLIYMEKKDTDINSGDIPPYISLMFIGLVTRWMAQLTNYLIGPNERIFDIPPFKISIFLPHEALGLMKQYFMLLGFAHSIASILIAFVFGLALIVFIKNVVETFEQI